MFYVLLLGMVDFVKLCKKLLDFLMKDCLAAPGLGWKYFNSMRDEKDEPVCTFNGIYMRLFARLNIKEGCVCAFNQYYESNTCGDILKILSPELEFEGKV